jgi:hypothetical protein
MSFQAFLAGIEHPELRHVARHWAEACRSRPMPAWQDIDPHAIARQLRIVWSWAYDREAAEFTYRLAGEEVRALVGKSARRGAKMAEIFTAAEYRVSYDRNKRIVLGPSLLHCAGRIAIEFNRHQFGEFVVMPLSTDGRHTDGVFGAVICDIRRNANGKAASLNDVVRFYDLDVPPG